MASAEKRIELQQAQAALENNTRTLLVQALGGLLLTAGAVASWRQLSISREGQFTERFTRAVDQLGSEQLNVRLGGIYALERLARNSRTDRGVIAEILTAFVRVTTPWAVNGPDGAPHPTPVVEKLPWLADRAADVQAAMTVLGRRPPAADEPRLPLSRVDLRHMYLSRARLADVNMRHANLARAWMRQVVLDDADLVDTDLREANLEGASLLRAKLRVAHLDRANLRGAQLTHATASGASFRDADLRGADLRGADLHEADLNGADLTGALHDQTARWPTGFDPDRLRSLPAATDPLSPAGEDRPETVRIPERHDGEPRRPA